MSRSFYTSIDYYRVFMFVFSLRHKLVYLLYLCPSFDINKINKQGCGLARKGHRKRYMMRAFYVIMQVKAFRLEMTTMSSTEDVYNLTLTLSFIRKHLKTGTPHLHRASSAYNPEYLKKNLLKTAITFTFY